MRTHLLTADPEDGRSDLLAPADRTAARGAQAGPFPERKTALKTMGRRNHNLPGTLGPLDVLKMIECLFLFDAEPFGYLPQIEAFLL
jgi:hypothetical protein